MTTSTKDQSRTIPAGLNPQEIELLQACHEVVVRSREMADKLASVLGVAPEQILYTWAFRRCTQSGLLTGSDWKYYFHGLECDLRNSADNRALRIDFGPGGRLNTFTAWGVETYIRHAITPWKEFPCLKEYYQSRKVGDDPLWIGLISKGAFDRADQSLLEFRERCTKKGPDGLSVLTFPHEISETMALDSSVAHRWQLSALGKSALGHAQ